MKSQNLGKTHQRGEISWALLGPTVGSVIPLATSPSAAPPVMVSVKCSGRLAIAMIDQVRAVAKERLVRHIEDLSTENLQSVEAALREILELD
jgi:mRNA-degrading endonuclease toxin of MazEF toxin-antitoxin module